jgi:formylglycine-generating enzyme required for sulfatase activity
VVGIFPQDAADCGAQDLAGNVWEWCSTPYLEYEVLRDQGVAPESVYTTQGWKERTYVLRGGSWLGRRDLARCAYRNHHNPDHFNGLIGFRLAHRSLD